MHTDTYAIDVRSIGRAGPEVHRALTRVMSMPQQAIVARLYQAPSELLTGLQRDTADQVAEALRETGLEVAVRPTDEVLTPGVPELDVALHLGAPARLPEVAYEVATFLGCDLPKAAELLCATPAVILGQVSQATVDALRARLESLDVRLDVSRSSEADYDLYIADCAPALRHRAAALVRAEGLDARDEGPVLATGCSLARTQRLWRAFTSCNLPVTVLNRDFQRFDVRLDGVDADTPELRAAIVAASGMPERIVGKVLARLPITLAQGVSVHDVPALLGRLADAGASATAHLVAFRRYALVIERVTEPGRTAEALSQLTRQDLARVRPTLQQLPLTIPGPFSQTRARWMRSEIAKTGARVRLDELA